MQGSLLSLLMSFLFYCNPCCCLVHVWFVSFETYFISGVVLQRHGRFFFFKYLFYIVFFLITLSSCFFYCQGVHVNCTLMIFVYKSFSPLICPKVCIIFFILFFECVFTDSTSRSDPVFSPFCARPLQQGQNINCKRHPMGNVSIPALSPLTFIFFPYPRTPLDASQPVSY